MRGLRYRYMATWALDGVPRRGAEGPRIVVKMKSRVDLKIQKNSKQKASHLPTYPKPQRRISSHS